MAATALTVEELDALRRLDTPTVCNALEITSPERRGSYFTVTPLLCAFPGLPPMAGYAHRDHARPNAARRHRR